jgi:hypothetical protein
MNNDVKEMFNISVKCGDACVDVYRDFDEDEIKNMPPSIQCVWEAGKMIVEYMESNP